MERKYILLLLIAGGLVLSGFLGYQYWRGTVPSWPSSSSNSETSVRLPTPNPEIPPDSVPYAVESFVQNLDVPWSMVFTSNDRLLVTERPGRIRVVEKGTLIAQPIRTFPEVSNESEEGLMGIELDPQYTENRYIYLCIAYDSGSQKFNKVLRVTDTQTALSNDQIIIDRIPAAEFHAGCRLRFGPDGKLYITTSDARTPKSAQDLSSLAGKILRINADGSIPGDNPIAQSPVYSFGHRNPQGLDWHPVTGALVATEHGPTGIDGPGGGDEINLIKAGSNYGWPVVSHEESQSGMTDPLLVFTPAVAPASGMFYRGSVFPQFTNHYFIGILKGTGILHVLFDQSGEKISSFETLSGIEIGRVRDIVEGPDGFIYFSTSNQDGRGKPSGSDDQIFRLVPRLQ